MIILTVLQLSRVASLLFSFFLIYQLFIFCYIICFAPLLFLFVVVVGHYVITVTSHTFAFHALPGITFSGIHSVWNMFKRMKMRMEDIKRNNNEFQLLIVAFQRLVSEVSMVDWCFTAHRDGEVQQTSGFVSSAFVYAGSWNAGGWCVNREGRCRWTRMKFTARLTS